MTQRLDNNGTSEGAAMHEQALLGLSLHNKELAITLITELTPDHFTRYEAYFAFLSDFWAKNDSLPTLPDYYTVFGNSAYDLLNWSTNYILAQKEEHLAAIKENYRLRQLSTAIENREWEKMMEYIYLDKQVPIEKQLQETRQKYRDRDGLLGLSTGFSQLDEITDGIQEGNIWVIGAYTSMGKTTFALNLAYHVLQQGKSVHFISLEMSPVQLASKLIGLYKGTNGTAYIKAMDTDKEAEDFATTNITYTYGVNHANHIVGKIYTTKADVIFIDYLQLIQGGGKTEYERMDNISKILQRTALKLQKSIICVSQVSNESVRNPNGFLLEYKGSGAIAASADVGIMIVPTDDPEERRRKIRDREPIGADVVIKKNRHGRVGDIPFEFRTYEGKFEEINPNSTLDSSLW